MQIVPNYIGGFFGRLLRVASIFHAQIGNLYNQKQSIF